MLLLKCVGIILVKYYVSKTVITELKEILSLYM